MYSIELTNACPQLLKAAAFAPATVSFCAWGPLAAVVGGGTYTHVTLRTYLVRTRHWQWPVTLRVGVCL